MVCSDRRWADSGAKVVIGISSMSSHFASYSISMGMSKLAMKRFIEFLDNEYKDQGLVVYALHPGGAPTRMSTSPGVPAELQTYTTSSRNGSVINMLTDV